MREIKFKYYCKDMAGKVFSFITTIRDLEQAKLNINTYGRIQEIVARCQYTGLKDKYGKGKEIYKGDKISRGDGMIYVVILRKLKGQWWLREYKNNELCGWAVPLMDAAEDCLEVIGTVHDKEEPCQDKS